ncbi:MAG: DnaJ domain-containing protein [Candidatus Polarisedimenticolaceae bacterium]|nr:DnaJ domain-containing protein [Candidatus Polarisedimenticolaceae bacterium]
MSENPLKPAILAILKTTEGELSEYQLIRQLEAEQAPFPVTEESADLALFQKHFIIMNALYQLQQSLLEDGFYLAISPLSIQLQCIRSSDKVLPADSADGKLRDYYLDWSQLATTSASDVDELLNGFWQRYLAIDKKTDALITLGLEDDVAWISVQQSYRRLVAQHHPDRGGDHKEFIAIREAYEILSGCYKR